MRFVVGVLACIGAGVLTVAVADPPEQPVHAASSPSTIAPAAQAPAASQSEDRKSTRLNSSHLVISYAVFCLKKKKTHKNSIALVYLLTIIDTVMTLVL